VVDVVGRSEERWVRMVAADDDVGRSEGPARVVSAMANATNESKVVCAENRG
jgi:hypothetical protein